MFLVLRSFRFLKDLWKIGTLIGTKIGISAVKIILSECWKRYDIHDIRNEVMTLETRGPFHKEPMKRTHGLLQLDSSRLIVYWRGLGSHQIG